MGGTDPEIYEGEPDGTPRTLDGHTQDDMKDDDDDTA